MRLQPASEEQAREYAFQLLSYRPRTASEIRQRLVARGCDPAVAGRVVDSLEDRGYVDDRAYAEQFVDERLRSRPAGRRYLLWHLVRRGVDRQLAQEVVDCLLTPQRELEAARDLAGCQPVKGEDDRLRTYRLLIRRGFPPRLARLVLDVDEHGEDA